MERIGVFGGSFDPVHNEHVNMAVAAMKIFSLDRLIVMPTFISPHKKGIDLAPAASRFDMLKIAFGDVKNAEVSDYEIKKEGVSYTCLTLEYLKGLYGGDLYFLLGTDMLADLPLWREPEKILSLCTPVVTPREGEDLASALSSFYDSFRSKPLVSSYCGKNLSSTKIRNLITLGLPTEGLLDGRVARYIKERGLYDGGEYAYAAKYVAENEKTSRLYHTAGVMTLAERYAKRLGVSERKARLAAMLHDVAKYRRYEDYGVDSPEGVPENVVHQFLGAYVCENVLGIKDGEILDAVRYHTTGRARMTDLERIIFIADLLEEGRDFAGVERLRKLVDDDFDNGFKICVSELMGFLRKTLFKKDIYYLSEECLEYYCKK